MQFLQATNYFCPFISHSSLIAMVVKIYTQIKEENHENNKVYGCMYVCMYICVYVCMYIYICVCVFMYYVCMYVCIFYKHLLACMLHYYGVILHALMLTFTHYFLSIQCKV